MICVWNYLAANAENGTAPKCKPPRHIMKYATKAQKVSFLQAAKIAGNSMENGKKLLKNDKCQDKKKRS